MHYTLLLSNPEPTPGEISPEIMMAFQSAYDRYAAALADAGVLVSIHILQPSPTATTVTLRHGEESPDRAYHDNPEKLSGIFIVDVPDHTTAMKWARECPGAEYGTVEVRPAALVYEEGRWVSA